jgi:hypothetical protein
MRGVKIFVGMVFAVLFTGLTYVGLVSRQSANADTTRVQNHTNATEREIAETSRIVNGQRR